jgi:hypothetical protein
VPRPPAWHCAARIPPARAGADPQPAQRPGRPVGDLAVLGRPERLARAAVRPGFALSHWMVDGMSVSSDKNFDLSQSLALYDRVEVVQGASGLMSGMGTLCRAEPGAQAAHGPAARGTAAACRPLEPARSHGRRLRAAECRRQLACPRRGGCQQPPQLYGPHGQPQTQLLRRGRGRHCRPDHAAPGGQSAAQHPPRLAQRDPHRPRRRRPAPAALHLPGLRLGILAAADRHRLCPAGT